MEKEEIIDIESTPFSAVEYYYGVYVDKNKESFRFSLCSDDGFVKEVQWIDDIPHNFEEIQGEITEKFENQ